MGETLYAVCLDIGGTSAKSALVDSDGNILPSSPEVQPVDSNGPAEPILAAFAAALQSQLDHAGERRVPLSGIGVSICGPFDYGKGISKITGLDKYESIYDVNVKQELVRRTGLPSGMPVLFDVDSWSFARGEVWAGAGSGYDRVIVLTMGSGVGSAFAVDGRIVDSGPGVPWFGWISGQKHREGILDEYVSRAFMIRQYRDLTGQTIEVAEMARRAFAGDGLASSVFEGVGRELGQFLRMHNVEEFGAECIVFGGQISKSFTLFEQPFREALSGIECLKTIVPAADIEGSALKGAGRFVFDSLRSTG